MTKPVRIQLRRAKGWRIPENTLKVDRTTKWGNPFIVGRDGTREDCVKLHAILLAGFYTLSATTSIDEQKAYKAHVRKNLFRLKGRNLACWCPLGAKCHADVLLEIAGQPKGKRRSKIVDGYLSELKPVVAS